MSQKHLLKHFVLKRNKLQNLSWSRNRFARFASNASRFVNDRATRWHLEEGGIPMICWHWGAPDIRNGYESFKKDFNLPASLELGTPRNKALNRDLAGVADQLTILRYRDITVLASAA